MFAIALYRILDDKAGIAVIDVALLPLYQSYAKVLKDTLPCFRAMYDELAPAFADPAFCKDFQAEIDQLESEKSLPEEQLAELRVIKRFLNNCIEAGEATEIEITPYGEYSYGKYLDLTRQ
jgi:hypothetical protein